MSQLDQWVINPPFDYVLVTFSVIAKKRKKDVTGFEPETSGS